MNTTTRISINSSVIINELKRKTGKSKVQIIDEALESYRYHEKMRILKEQYECLRVDEKAWEKELEDRRELDGTLMDGLENE